MQPSLPVPSSNLSHWHQTTRSFPYLNVNRLENAPDFAKYVVIGSGISGALIAWELINRGVKGEDVLILEAREAVSGATGRNAGHIRPDAFVSFPRFSAIHGPAQAKSIIESETVVLNKVKDFVESNGVNCDFNYTTTFEIALTQNFAQQLKKALAEFHAAGGDTSHVKYYEDEEAKGKTGVADAICAYEWPAGSNHPGKLCQWILKDFIEKGGRLWTHCPATKVTKNQGASSAHKWEVHTPRGVTATENVIHCTNAYAAFLLPELAETITPRRAQGHAYVPPLTLSGENTLKSTLSLGYGHKHFFSVNPLKDGTIIFGGGATRSDLDWTPEFLKDKYSFNDAAYNPLLMKSSIEEFSKLASVPEAGPARPGEGLSHVWTGIVGETPDSVPFVGPIDGLDGQWICAGFNGHGMARIFTCAPGLVKLIFGDSWSATGIPECFQFHNRRIKTLKTFQVKV